VVSEVDEAAALLAKLVAEMERRKTLFTSIFVEDLAGYNEQAESPLPLILVVVDEVTDIALEAGLKSPFFQCLTRLMSKGRALGFVLVLATQTPKAEVLNTLVRNVCATSIAFRARSAEHSRMIMEEGGAEALPGGIKGRMLARLQGNPAVLLQGYYVDQAAVAALARRLRGDVAGPEPGALLGDVERELVQTAIEQLGGYFVIGRLAEMVEGVTKHQVDKTARQWETLGLLTEPQFGESGRQLGRRVTPELARMAGMGLPPGELS